MFFFSVIPGKAQPDMCRWIITSVGVNTYKGSKYWPLTTHTMSTSTELFYRRQGEFRMCFGGTVREVEMLSANIHQFCLFFMQATSSLH